MQETGFLDRSLHLEGREYRYVVYVPRDLAVPAPVVLFLHGIGERGTDGLIHTQGGLGLAIRQSPASWPGIVVFPQVPEDEVWHGRAAAAAMAALDRTIEEHDVDTDRVYLTGLSLGGNGSWYLAFHHPERFAAAAVVCGFVSERPRVPAFLPDAADVFAEVAERASTVPTWVFHGDQDDAVPVEESRRMVEALQRVGADVRYSELAGVGHGAWGPAYAMPELTDWLFSQRRAKA